MPTQDHIFPNKKDIQIIRKTIKLIQTGWGRRHIKKHKYDFDIDCNECQAQMVATWLQNAIGFERNTDIKTQK